MDGLVKQCSKMSSLKVFTYGAGNFASQLSWTMVSTYLALFYTDVLGLEAASVALLLLLAKTIDALCDPVLGAIMERTDTRWGRFRPYMFIGAPLLVVFTILTFTVPGFGSTMNLLYAYVTYIGLSIAYSVVNVPYTALPAVITDNKDDVNRLTAANSMGMVLGMIILNLCTLPLVTYLGQGNASAGYQSTATLYAVIALPIFLIVAKFSKEVIKVNRKRQVSVRKSLKYIIYNKNLMMVLGYMIASTIASLGRIGVCVYFYIYIVKDMRFITIFMVMQMIMGAILMPFAPKIIGKFGKKSVCIVGNIFAMLGMAMMFFGPQTNIIYLFISHIIYGLFSITLPCGSGMLVDVVEETELKSKIRIDGTAFALSNLGTKIGSAIGASVGMMVIGLFGYAAGQEVTAHVAYGINFASNMVPLLFFAISTIPLLIYDLTEKKAKNIHEELQKEREGSETAPIM